MSVSVSSWDKPFNTLQEAWIGKNPFESLFENWNPNSNPFHNKRERSRMSDHGESDSDSDSDSGSASEADSDDKDELVKTALKKNHATRTKEKDFHNLKKQLAKEERRNKRQQEQEEEEESDADDSNSEDFEQTAKRKGTKCKCPPSNTVSKLKNSSLRRTFNLSVMKKLVVDLKVEHKIATNIGKSQIAALEQLFKKTVLAITERVKNMKDNQVLINSDIEAKDKTGELEKKRQDQEKKGSVSLRTQEAVIREMNKFFVEAKSLYVAFYKHCKQFYLRKMRHNYGYISRFMEYMDMSEDQYNLWAKRHPEDSKELGWAYEDYRGVMKTITDEVMPNVEKLSLIIKGVGDRFADVYLSNFSTLKSDNDIDSPKQHGGEVGEKLKNLADRNSPDASAAFGKKSTEFIQEIATLNAKLISIYNNEHSLMDIVLDSHFIACYVLKAFHFLLIIMSLFLTEKIFSEMYMKNVYAQNSDPPNLVVMICIFLAIDFGLIMFMLTVLFLTMYIFQRPSGDFIINADLIKAFIIDWGIYVLLLFTIICIVAQYMQTKKYFRYNTEGLRAIRALKSIIMAVSVVLLAVPFFAFV